MHLSKVYLIILAVVWIIVSNVGAFIYFKKHGGTPTAKTANATAGFITTPITEWRYNRVVCSGLGDRLCLLFAMAGLGRATNTRVHVRWCEEGAERRYDLKSFNSMFTLPVNVVFTPSSQFASETKSMPDVGFERTEITASEGFDCVYTLGPKTFHAPGAFDALSYPKAYKAAGQEWALRTNAKRQYVVIHARGADKQDPNLDDFCTKGAVRKVADAGWPIVLISDDSELSRLIIASSDNVNITVPADDTVFHHLSILHSAVGIIQHSRDGWSAFSSSVAMFRGIPLLNTWRGQFNRIQEFRLRGGHTNELKTCDDTAHFIQMLGKQ
jgi:hypothetical protein